MWSHRPLSASVAIPPVMPEAEDAERLAAINAHLVHSLVAQPATVALATMFGVVSATAVALMDGTQLFRSLAVLLGSIAMLRLASVRHYAFRPAHVARRRVERVYAVGAASYALALGCFAAATQLSGLDPQFRSLMIANALGYGIGICIHNAARPRVALTQLALVSAPVAIAGATLGGVAGWLLAANIVLLFPAMGAIARTVNRLLRESALRAVHQEDIARRMEHLALTDPVTGLSNRVGLDVRLGTLAADLADDASLAVFWADLDRFKEFNDLNGHHAGDALLSEIGKRLVSVFGEDAIIARFAGDEFVIVCSIAGREAAQALALDTMAEITRPWRLESRRIEMEGAIGIAVGPDDGDDFETLLCHADIALFEAKAHGRRQIRFFDPAMTRALAHRREMESELREALSRDQLSVYFQPIVDLATGRIRCFEALVRWFHPEKGEIKPDEFIPIAEECGAIVTLGNWLTARAAAVAANWPEDVSLAVNLSPLQIRAPGAALGILSALREARLDPARVELEVTEGLFLDDSAEVAAFIAQLSAAGVRFALDDFGTGYSSLAYINRWPFSKIKVDRSFVSGPQSGRKSDAIIRAVSQIGQTLGIDIVAEGLETSDQVNAVREAGCTHGQGFHFSRAVPDYQAALMLAEERDAHTSALRRAG